MRSCRRHRISIPELAEAAPVLLRRGRGALAQHTSDRWAALRGNVGPSDGKESGTVSRGWSLPVSSGTGIYQGSVPWPTSQGLLQVALGCCHCWSQSDRIFVDRISRCSRHRYLQNFRFGRSSFLLGSSHCSSIQSGPLGTAGRAGLRGMLARRVPSSDRSEAQPVRPSPPAALFAVA